MCKDCTICGRDLSTIPLGGDAEELVNGFEAISDEVNKALPGVNNAVAKRLAVQVVSLKDFFAASPLGGGDE